MSGAHKIFCCKNNIEINQFREQLLMTYPPITRKGMKLYIPAWNNQLANVQHSTDNRRIIFKMDSCLLDATTQVNESMDE